MVACASQDSPVQVGYDEGRAERLFTAGYGNVSDIYIEEVPVSDLAVAGMQSLASIDPALAVAVEGDRLRVSFDSRPLASFPVADPRDPAAWGALTSAVISVSRYHSRDLDAADPEKIYEAVFDGLLAQLDGFSRYAGRDTARENRANRDGFGGIGVRIRLIEEGILVLSVMEDTPAQAAGLQADDVIVAIDGKSVEGLSQHEAVNRLRGRTGSQVELNIERAADAPLTLAVERSHIVPQTVTYHREGNLGYIKMTGFNKRTADSLRERIGQARNEIGNELRGFILDLRGNPGGLLEQAVAVSDIFVDNGRIVSIHGRHTDSHQYYPAKQGDLTENAPLVVLIDGGSASASEIVAAALQDSGRAVLVGSNSYGKGTVQTVLPLPNTGELILTWARFHAPSGYALHRRGVLPDVCTSGNAHTAAEVLTQVHAGSHFQTAELRHRDVDISDDSAIEDFRAHCPAREEEDAQVDLEVARQLLEEPGLYARTLHGLPDTAASSHRVPDASGS